jgi:hypothetical protein
VPSSATAALQEGLCVYATVVVEAKISCM